MFGNICGNGQLESWLENRGTSVERSGFFCAKKLLTESHTAMPTDAKSRTHGCSNECKELGSESHTVVVTNAKSCRQKNPRS
jgi:hypothetical protein